MATVALFPLLEVHDDIRPVDHAGNVNDLSGDPGSTPALAMPAIAASAFGRGRAFGTDIGLVATEQVAGATRLTRDATIRAFLSYAIAAAANGDKGTIVARGRGGSNAERILFGAEIERVDATTAKLRARWQDKTGTEATVAGAAFVVPAGAFHVAVIRRWLSTTEVEVEYVVNDTLIGSETVTLGDIGEGSGGTLLVGAAGSGSNYTRFLPTGSVLDMLAIDDDAMAFEEVRQDFRSVTVHQPSGYTSLLAYLPPGESMKRAAGSRVQRVLASLGDAIGHVVGEAERLREDFLPDRAYGAALERWESVLALAPKPADTIAQRRARVLGFTRRVLGFPIEDIKTALEPLFGLDADDIDVIEFAAVRADGFDTDDITTPPSKIWVTRAGDGTISIAAGVCSVSVGSGDLVRWGQNPAHREACITPATHGDTDGATFLTKIDITTLADSVLYGHAWRTGSLDEALVLGYRLDGATHKISAYRVVGGVVQSLTDLFTTGVAEPIWLRSRYDGGDDYSVWFSTTGPTSGYGNAVAVVGPTSPRWVGFGLFGTSASALGATRAADFDDAQIFEPNSTRPFHWYAYRDPALGGTYDKLAAEAQLAKQKPAHTHTCVLTDLDGLALGSGGRLGCEPLYPLGA